MGASGTREQHNGLEMKIGLVKEHDARQLKIRKALSRLRCRVKHSTRHKTKLGRKRKEKLSAKNQ